ncbi:MAG: hypothetical protein IJN57_10385 [Oscillospiraceae bacterium]|nr:hypothetical protein [Oscillospiraceae bacterium]
MAANKDLTPYGLQVYLYLAANADGYEFGLSPEHAKEVAGIARTTFYDYLKLLEIKGYLVWRRGNVFDFYTSPRPKNERTYPEQRNGKIEFVDASSADGRPAQEQFAF